MGGIFLWEWGAALELGFLFFGSIDELLLDHFFYLLLPVCRKLESERFQQRYDFVHKYYLLLIFGQKLPPRYNKRAPGRSAVYLFFCVFTIR